ncbi:hypothetical protein [Oscillatoria acuminata]|uniref:hypothetical protein n=1 Tax=Oscillatoria acuminata TaxID=118323 RepID=UPI0002D3FB60|nr:hypothetical protein [Oscillatoria acuminata]
MNLFRFVDRMMKLPKELEEQLTTEIIEGREERQMPFMSQFEEIAQEKGIERGTVQNQRENTLAVLEVRFGDVPPEVVEAVNGIEDIPTLKQLHRQAIAIGSVAQFQELLNSVIEG